MTDFTQKTCRPCEGIGSILDKEQVQKFLKDLEDWKTDDKAKMISRDFIMKNFLSAVQFISKVALVAEKEDHHPDIHLTGYRKLNITLSTHAIGGLSENDFIVAAKINQLPVELKT